MAKQLVFQRCPIDASSRAIGCLWSDATRYTYYLGADPVEYSLHTLGVIAALLLLVHCLLVLAAFGLACAFDDAISKTGGGRMLFLCLLARLLFAQFYVGWSTEALANEFASRPYILMGGGAVMLLGC